MPTLPNMLLITPTLGGDSGTWDDKINACFELIDAHDHTTGKGVKIVPAAMNINADIAMAGNGLANLSKASFSTIALPTTGSKAIFVSSTDNELYWRTSAGVNVKLTNGSSINTTLVGGIVGDYSTVGAEVAYDNANKRYTFKDNSSPSKKWARLASGPVRLHEYDTTESVYVELAAPAALGGSYTVTFPDALIVQNGVVRAYGTSAGADAGKLEFSRTLELDDYYYSNEIPIVLPACDATEASSTHTKQSNGFGAHVKWLVGASANAIAWAIPVRAGDTITGFTVYVDKNTDGTAQIEAQIVKTSGTTGVETAIGAGDSSLDNAPNFITLTETGLSEGVDGTAQYYLVFTPSGSVTPAADVLYHATVTITRPEP